MSGSGRAPVHVHAHFAHDPAVVGLLVARLTGLPFTFTAHARDLFQTPPAQLRLRTAEARTVVTCCAAGATHLTEVVPAQHRPTVRLVHHGVRLDRFTPQPVRRPATAPLLVSVGRLVEKKGYDDLLRALAVLQRNGTPFTCHVYGDGPLEPELTVLRDRLGLADSVTLRGAQPAQVIREALGSADGFALTPRVTADGDRDGIPNVLVEALACGLGVVTTSAGGILELVRDEQNGLVAPPGDVAMIAHQLTRLLDDTALRRRLGNEGRRTVESDYDVDAAAEQLALLFGADLSSVSEEVR
jgi:glycosyltransferase involved in cell wall biosynthesis